MKFIYFSLLFSFLLSNSLFAQNQTIESKNVTTMLPYHEIPAYPETYTAANATARMVDGLGYRYYWATKDLRQADLDYKPSEDGKSTDETLDHLYGLSVTIFNAITGTPNIRPTKQEEMSYEQKRKATLETFHKTSELLKVADLNVEDLKIVFQRGENKSEFPFWHLLNGPIADAIYHVGQIVVFRRAAGNPLHPFVNVFTGKTKE